MAERVLASPVLVRVLSSKVNADDSAALLYEAEDGRRFAITLTAEVLGASVLAMATLLGQLDATRPQGVPRSLQALPARKIEPALAENGQVGLSLLLDTGGRLVLSVPQEQVHELAQALSEIVEMAKPRN